MSDSDMEEMQSEMYHLYRAGAAIDFATWDAECEPHKKYDGKLNFERTKCGGTELSCAVRYANEHRRKNHWDFVVIATDGYIEHNPEVCKIPCLILISENGTTEGIETPHKMVKINRG